MTSITTSTTFTCISCDQTVLLNIPHECDSKVKHIPVMTQTVMDAIYNCKRCNPTEFTFYRCNCDMGVPQRRMAIIPMLTLPLEPITEVEENTDDFTAAFKFDDDDNGRPNTPESQPPIRRRNAIASSLDFNTNELPADLVSRCQAIDKIFQNAKEKK